jgi:hypothetical protein
MSRYQASNSKAGVNTAGTIMWQLRPTTTAQRMKVLEIGIGVASAPTTAPSFQLARSTAIGTSTTTAAGQPYDQADTAALGTLDSAWSVNPTSAGVTLRQSGLAVTAGGQLFWTFYDVPLVMFADTTDGLLIINANASGATLGTFTCYMVWQE